MCSQETIKERELPSEALQRELAGKAEKLARSRNHRQRAFAAWLEDTARRIDA